MLLLCQFRKQELTPVPQHDMLSPDSVVDAAVLVFEPSASPAQHYFGLEQGCRSAGSSLSTAYEV